MTQQVRERWTTRRRLLAIFMLLVMVALFNSQYWCPIFYNRTASVPTGLYHYTREPLQRGIFIMFPQPHKPGVRTLNILPARGLLKYVAALPGDLVEVTPTAILVNGRRWPNSQAPDPPSLLDHCYLGRHIVPPGYVWALGTNSDSFDSRFFGPVPVSSIVGTAAPRPLSRIPNNELCNYTGPSPNPCFLRTESAFRK